MKILTGTVRNVDMKGSDEAGCWPGYNGDSHGLMLMCFGTNTEEGTPAAPAYLENVHPCDPAPHLGRKLKERPTHVS